jgi:fatty acid desaturase/predicted heme/steroid binding protein
MGKGGLKSIKINEGNNNDEQNSFTVEEVEKFNHLNSRKDGQNQLVIFKDFVYDISAWIEKHPGGETVLKQYAGRDITDAFRAYHSDTGKAMKTMKTLLVGKIERSSSITTTTEDSKTTDNNRAQAPTHLRDFRKIMEKAEETEFKTDYRHYYAIAIRLVSLLSLAVHLVVNKNDTFSHMVAAVSLGMFWQQSMFIGHDAGHCAVTHNRTYDTMIGWVIGNMCNGVGISWWSATHNVHHCAVNSLECDPDIQHMPIFAVTKKYFNHITSLYHNRQLKFDWFAKKFVRVQHYTFYPIMAVARVNLYAQTLIHVATAKMSKKQRVIEFATLGFYFAWYSALISMLPSSGEKWAFFFLSHAVGGIIHIQICLSHFSRDVFEGIPKNNEWVEMQLSGTMDIECPKYLDWFHGGLQFQVEHHLCPRLPRHKLREFRETVIKPYMAKYKLENFHSVGFLEANIQVWKTLKKAASQSVLSPAFSTENYI